MRAEWIFHESGALVDVALAQLCGCPNARFVLALNACMHACRLNSCCRGAAITSWRDGVLQHYMQLADLLVVLASAVGSVHDMSAHLLLLAGSSGWP